MTSERAAVSASHCLGNDTLLFPLWFIWRSRAEGLGGFVGRKGELVCCGLSSDLNSYLKTVARFRVGGWQWAIFCRAVSSLLSAVHYRARHHQNSWILLGGGGALMCNAIFLCSDWGLEWMRVACCLYGQEKEVNDSIWFSVTWRHACFFWVTLTYCKTKGVCT